MAMSQKHDPREGFWTVFSEQQLEVLWKHLNRETDQKVTFGTFPFFLNNYRKSLKKTGNRPNLFGNGSKITGNRSTN